MIAVALAAGLALAQGRDSVSGDDGEIIITPIAHATVHVEYGAQVVLVDPTIHGGWDGPYPGGVAPKLNYDGLDPASLILVTDVHGDHFDPDAIAKLRTKTTKLIVPAVPGFQWPAGAIPIANGRSQMIDGITVTAVPMYNLLRGPTPEARFHDKGRGNGYVIGFGGKRLYFSGDTECTPEMKALKNIDVAFIAMNLPYTSTPEEAAECVQWFKPAIVYPYHYKGQDPKVFESKLAGSGIEVRLRDWYSLR